LNFTLNIPQGQQLSCSPAGCSFSEPLFPLLPSVARRYVFLTFPGCLLTDSLFVAGLGNLTAVSIVFVKELRKKVAIPIFVKDQFTFCRLGFVFRVLDLKKRGSGAIYAANFHECQIGIVQHLDAVLTRWEFGVARVELEWDVASRPPMICACAWVE
jgi:hypothetical protein